MNVSAGLVNFETVFARLAFDLAASVNSPEAMNSVLAAQRSVLLEPFQALLAVLDAVESEGVQLDLRVPEGLEIPKRLVPAISEFLVEAVRNWRAHGHMSRAERKFAAKPDQARVLLAVEPTSSGLRLEFHDDGPGLNPRAVLAHLKKSGKLSEQEFSALEAAVSRSELELLYAWLFEDGITTRQQPGMEAGNGVGLARISSLCSELGGRAVATSSSVLGGFRFSIELPCSILGLSVEPVSEGVFGLMPGDRSSEGLSRGQFRLFYRVPVEAKPWIDQTFGGCVTSWISLESAPQNEPPAFRAAGLKLNSTNV